MQRAVKCISIPNYDDGDKLIHTEGEDVSIWYGMPAPHFRGEHKHDRYQVIIMPELRTRCELFWREIDGAARSRLFTGSLACFIEKGISHAIRWEVQAPLIYLCIAENYFTHFSGEKQRHGAFIRRWGELTREDGLLTGLMERICELIHTPVYPVANYPIGLGMSLAAQLLRNPKFWPTATVNDGLAPFLLKKVLDYIETHLSEQIKVEDLAREVNLSKGYFTRLFTASTGETPHHYIVNERLKCAKGLLQKGVLKTAAIAAETGFHDQSHLSRSMHRRAKEHASAHVTNIQTESTNIQSKPDETGQHGGTL